MDLDALGPRDLARQYTIVEKKFQVTIVIVGNTEKKFA